MRQTKNILIAFSSRAAKDLLEEIFLQLDRSVRIIYSVTELDVLSHLCRKGADRLPGLILFDSPPVKPDLARFVDNMRTQMPMQDIPVVVFLPPDDIPVMKKWLRSADIHFYPQSSKPSDCKYFARRALELYTDGSVVDREQ